MAELTKQEKQIIKKIHAYVKKECKGFSNDDDVFECHIMGVVNFVEKIADLYESNKFVVILAAYLHDITYIQTKNHETHEVEGSKFVKVYLKQFDMPQNEIDQVSLCILNHRGSKENKRNSIEEKIVACADAMDHIARYKHMFERCIKTSGEKEAREFMKGKIQRGWQKIELEKARALVKDKYEEAKREFDN